MPPVARPRPDAAGPAASKEQRLVQLRLARASLVAQIPSDEDYKALVDAQRAAQDSQRRAAQDRLATIEQQISELEAE